MPGFGYIPSPEDKRDLKTVGDDTALFGSKFGASVPTEHYNWLRFVEWIRDQGITSSCVWNAMQQQHFVRLGIRGISKRIPMSRLFGYWHTRHRNGSHTRDFGCIPREAWKAAAGMGFCKETLWPFDEGRVNDKPDFDATSGAVDQKWLEGYYMIWGLTGRDNEVRQCIAKGHPVVFGTVVDQDFQDYRNGRITDVLKPPRGNKGRHMMCGVAYDTDGLWVINSWGKHWGSPDPTGKLPGGFFRMSWEWVNWSQATDWWAVEFAQNFVVP